MKSRLTVWSRHLVERFEPEPFRLDRPSFADELVGREPLQGFEATGAVVGGDEVRQVHAQLLVGGVVEALNGRLLDGAVMRSTCPFVHGCRGLVSRWATSFWAQAGS